MPRLIFVLAMFLACPAWAESWTDCVSGGALQPPAVGGKYGDYGKQTPSACNDIVASGDTPMIYVTAPATLTYDPDSGQAGAPRGVAVTITVYRCVNATASLLGCHDVFGVLIFGDDGAHASSDASAYDIPAGLYYVTTSGAPTGGATPRVRFELATTRTPPE